jgi:hypothetical protein
MEKLSRARTAAVGTMVVLAGVFAAPQAAHASGINKCEERWNINQTQHTVRCNGSFLDSDLYRAYVVCDGRKTQSSNRTTPVLGGWGEWVTAYCPLAGQTYSRAGFSTSD